MPAAEQPFAESESGDARRPEEDSSAPLIDISDVGPASEPVAHAPAVDGTPRDWPDDSSSVAPPLVPRDFSASDDGSSSFAPPLATDEVDDAGASCATSPHPEAESGVERKSARLFELD